MAVIDGMPGGGGGFAAGAFEGALFWGVAAAEGVLAVSCLSIPAALAIVARRREAMPFGWLLGLFMAFLAAAGLARLLWLGALWLPAGGAAAAATLLAALLAAGTALALWRFLPLILAQPSLGRLEAVNTALSAELVTRRAREARLGEVNETLEEGREMLERICEGLRETAAEARAVAERRAEHLATMSHEIRTPLHGIIGMLAMLRDRIDGAEEGSLVARAGDSADALLRLLDDTLDQSRAEARGEAAAPDLAPFVPAEIAEQVAGLFGATAEAKGLALVAEIAPEAEGAAHGDAVAFRQILSNLVGNAVKFTEAGRIVIRLGRDAAEGPRFLVAEVEDTGPGIPPGRRETLFDRYARGEEPETVRAAGSGLGLTICRDLADARGGHITLDSGPGQGTRVRVTLPCPALPPPGGRACGAGEGAARLAGRRVLVVDDNETNRLIARHALAPAGVTVGEAATGQEALAKLADGPVDAVLLDLSLPDLDGVEVASMIRHGGACRADLPIVVVSAHARATDSMRLLALGIAGYLAKPFRPAALREALAEALAERPAGGADRRGAAAGAPHRAVPVEGVLPRAADAPATARRRA